MPTPDGQEPDTLPREATSLENVGEAASEESRQMTDEPAMQAIQRQTMVQEMCCQFKKFWRQQVSVIVNHEASRDHLGMCVRLATGLCK